MVRFNINNNNDEQQQEEQQQRNKKPGRIGVASIAHSILLDRDG
jgi:hypothetical protein